MPTAEVASRQRVSLLTVARKAVGEDAIFADCPTWQSTKRAGPGPRPGHVAVCRLVDVAVGKEAILANCPTSGQSANLTATDAVYARRDLPTAELCRLLGSSLPTAFLSRLPGSGFAECLVWQSAKTGAVGKAAVSRSACVVGAWTMSARLARWHRCPGFSWSGSAN